MIDWQPPGGEPSDEEPDRMADRRRGCILFGLLWFVAIVGIILATGVTLR
jgi:hypothetical protein